MEQRDKVNYLRKCVKLYCLKQMKKLKMKYAFLSHTLSLTDEGYFRNGRAQKSRYLRFYYYHRVDTSPCKLLVQGYLPPMDSSQYYDTGMIN